MPMFGSIFVNMMDFEGRIAGDCGGYKWLKPYHRAVCLQALFVVFVFYPANVISRPLYIELSADYALMNVGMAVDGVVSQAERAGMAFTSKYGGNYKTNSLSDPGGLMGLRLGGDYECWDRVNISAACGIWGSNDEIRVDMNGLGAGGQTIKDSWVVPLSGYFVNLGVGYRVVGDKGWGIVAGVRPGISIYQIVGKRRLDNFASDWTGNNFTQHLDLYGRTITIDACATVRSPENPFILELGYRLMNLSTVSFSSGFDMNQDNVGDVKPGGVFQGANGEAVPFNFSGIYVRAGFMFQIFGPKQESVDDTLAGKTVVAPIRNPQYVEEYKLAGESYSTKEYDTAIARLKPLLSVDPNYWEAWQLLGNCHYAKGNTAEAVKAYDRALVINPDNPQLRTWSDSLKGGGTTQ